MKSQKPLPDEFKVKRASVLGLPTELRLRIYHEVFRVKSWEAHQYRIRNAGFPRRRLSDSCPVCQDLSKDGGCLYPSCRLVSKEGELVLTRSCHTPSNPHEQLHRTAILRTCRTIYSEAVDQLYKHTPFVLLLAKNVHFFQTRPEDIRRVQGESISNQLHIFLPKVRNLNVHIACQNEADLEALIHQLSNLMAGVWRGRGRLTLEMKALGSTDGPGGSRGDRIDGVVLTSKYDKLFRLKVWMVVYRPICWPCSEEWYAHMLKKVLTKELLQRLSLKSTDLGDENDTTKLDDLFLKVKAA